MTDSEHPATGDPAAPAGYYSVGPGPRRYWDGAAWTDQFEATPNPGDERTMAMLAHLLALFASILGPLLIYLLKKDESAFVRHHGAEALNFSISVLIALVASGILTIVLIGIVLLPIVGVAALVFHIMAAVAASKGEWYRYPLSIRFIT
jgi:hypothetical protein